MPATDTTDSSSIGLDNPFGTSDTYANSNISVGGLPTGGDTYSGTNIATGSLPTGGTTYSGTTIDNLNAPPTSVSGTAAADTTGTDTTDPWAWLKNLTGGANFSNLASTGAALAAAKQQQADNARLAGTLRDQSTPILASGQKQLANYDQLTDLERKAMDAGVSAGTALTGDADPLLGIGRTAFGDYTAGKLPAWQQAEIDAQVAQQKAMARQSLGANVDSTTLAQMDAQIDKNAEITKGNLLSQNLTAGEAAYKQGTDLVGAGGAAIKAAYDKASADISRNLADALATITTGLGPLTDSINLEMKNNSALAKAMTDLMAQIAKATASTGGGGGGGGVKLPPIVDKIIDKITGGGTVTPPSIDDVLKGTEYKGPIEPVLPYTPPPSPPPPTSSVGLENPDGTPITEREDPTGTDSTDPTGTQSTDPTGTSPVAPEAAVGGGAAAIAAATPPAATGPTASITPEEIPSTTPATTPPTEPPTGAPETTAPAGDATSVSSASSGSEIATAIGATGAAATALAAASAAAVPHVATLIVAEELGAAAATSASAASAVAATSEALAAAGVSTAETSAIASAASSSVAAGSSVTTALMNAASVALPVAVTLAVTFALFKALGLSDDIRQLSREELDAKFRQKEAEEADFYASHPEEAAKLQSQQLITAATQTPNEANTPPEQLAQLWATAGGDPTEISNWLASRTAEPAAPAPAPASTPASTPVSASAPAQPEQQMTPEMQQQLNDYYAQLYAGFGGMDTGWPP